MTKKEHKKDIILFIWKLTKEHLASVKNLNKITGQRYRVFLLTTSKYEVPKELAPEIECILRANFKAMSAVEDKLKPYHNDIALIVNRWESTMPFYGRLLELFPYLHGANTRSMQLASNKFDMRQAFLKYDKKITPMFMKIKNSSEKTLKSVKEKIGFPSIIKPVGLSSSQLVSVNYYGGELKKSLDKAFKKIYSLFKSKKVEHEPQLIVEEFMEGQMYSIDAYVNSRGKVFFAPMIDIKTGKEAGYDDLFLYLEITPTILPQKEIEAARETSGKAIEAIGLKSSSAHIELMRTPKGWKVIEMAARVGGFRNEMYREAFGFDHKANDYCIHLGKEPVIKRTPKQHVAKLKFYPKKPGKIISIGGLQTVKEMKSVVSVYQEKKIGDFADYAKNGHTFVVTFIIKAKTRDKLLGEVRKIEQLIKIETN